MSLHDELQSRLEAQLRSLEARAGRIRADRRRAQGPLDRDSEEQALELENAEVLDLLDDSGRSELAEVYAALQRLNAGSFGSCQSCGGEIAEARLRALPTAVECIRCAEAASR